jgi:hypothetical protein
MSFTRLDPTDFVVSSDSITAPAWSNNATILQTFFTASAATTGSYYLNVYNADTAITGSAVQFAIAYGRADGSGSAPINPLVVGNSPTRITFGQYRNLIYGDAEAAVNFGSGNTSSIDLIAIPVDRNRYKESLFPGTFNLQLNYSSSTSPLKLTDNSNDVTTVSYVDGGRVYYIVSGSNGTAANSPLISGAAQQGFTPSGSYGLFLPDIGLIVLNPLALTLSTSVGGLALPLLSGSASNVVSASSLNQDRIYECFKSASYFQLNAQETISSDYIFVRVKNQDYNYTTNPSIISGSGALIYSNFINSPQTFPTSVGLYNDNNELLAVAKMSKPLTKDFTKEALIRVKLDW